MGLFCQALVRCRSAEGIQDRRKTRSSISQLRVTETDKHHVLITGWRGIPHSYAVISQFLCLEFLCRDDVCLYFEDRSFYDPEWNKVTGLFSPEDEAAIAGIPGIPDRFLADFELRISFPFDLVTPPKAKRFAIYATSESLVVPPEFIVDQVPLRNAHSLHSATIFTTSNWSSEGFLASGADPTRLRVVPLGVDPAIFHPVSHDDRNEYRNDRKIGENDFVFVFIGAMTGNKNPELAIRTFAAVLRDHPRCRLLLKGSDSLYPSYQLFKSAMLASLSGVDFGNVFSRLTYIGDDLSVAEMAKLYQLSDCYISPYKAEGFNLPVLEAAACGLPVICTSGGPTDDFTNDKFAWRISSHRKQLDSGTHLEPDADHFEKLMREIVMDEAFSEQASIYGPKHVHENFTWKNTCDLILKDLSNE